MKKYIRTNYGTIEPNIESIERVITNEADSIENLCDAFVVVDGNQIAEFHNFNLAKNTKGELYGIIYCVDKNGNEIQKTVAKMNKEGELELL